MSDENVIPLPGSEDGKADKKVELERLNTLLETAVGALGEAAEGDVPHEEFMERLGRAKRLVGELEGVLEALGVDPEPAPVMVRVISPDGEQEQHEVTFPIYAKGERGEFRRIDDEMIEVTFIYDNIAMQEERCGAVKRRIDFLDGKGADYWLGRGEYKLSAEDFDRESARIAWEIMRMAGVDEDDVE